MIAIVLLGAVWVEVVVACCFCCCCSQRRLFDRGVVSLALVPNGSSDSGRDWYHGGLTMCAREGKRKKRETGRDKERKNR